MLVNSHARSCKLPRYATCWSVGCQTTCSAQTVTFGDPIHGRPLQSPRLIHSRTTIRKSPSYIFMVDRYNVTVLSISPLRVFIRGFDILRLVSSVLFGWIWRRGCMFEPDFWRVGKDAVGYLKRKSEKSASFPVVLEITKTPGKSGVAIMFPTQTTMSGLAYGFAVTVALMRLKMTKLAAGFDMLAV